MSDVDVEAREAARALEEMASSIERATKRALKVAVDETEKHAKATTLFVDRTGRTRASIEGTVNPNGVTARVRAGGVATWLENGTPPHRIEPRKRSVLVFQANGDTVFARAVNHPGTAERPFMQQARDHGAQVLDYGLDEYLTSAIRK